MPITKSSKKAVRVGERRRVQNLRRKRAVERELKRTLIEASNLPLAYQAIDKAAKRGVLKKNTAARMKSRLVATVRRGNKTQ